MERFFGEDYNGIRSVKEITKLKSTSPNDFPFFTFQRVIVTFDGIRAKM